MRPKYIVDNRQTKMAKELRKCCKGAHTFHIAVGYFYVEGFNILRDRLGSIGKIHLIMGDQTDRKTADQLKIGHENTHEEAIREQIIRSMNNVPDGPEAEMLLELYEYIRVGRMEVRIYVKNKFHAKAYIFERDAPNPDVAFVGSSNLSVSGLGDKIGNVELNIQSQDTLVIDTLLKWYEDIWKDALPYSDELLNIIEHTVPYARRQNDQEYVTPRELFKIMAYELLGEPEESEPEDVLAEFQKIGVLNAWDKIQKFGGCIVADSVGLGKTFIGMELIRKAQAAGRNALVIVPKNVEQNWRRELEKYSGAILDDSRLKIITVDRLSRMDQSQAEDSAELESLRNNYGFIIIDEAHRFRNKGYYTWEYSGNKNYANLDTLKTEKTQYALLTATPLNNTVEDLENLILIFTVETRLKNINPALDISHFGEYNKLAKKIKDLDKNDPAYDANQKGLKELQEPHESGITRILEEVIVLRTRSDINERYSNEVIGGKRISFTPIKVVPNRCRFPPVYMELYESVVELLAGLNVPHMSMKTGGTVQLQGLFMTLLYKRLESSIHSFVMTLERLVETEENLLKLTERVGWKEAAKKKRADDDLGLDEYGLWMERNETMQDKVILDKLRDDIHMIKGFIDEHVEPIRKVARYVDREIAGYVDPKLDMLLKMLQSETGKVLVFTQYRDTAEYLYDRIKHIDKTVDCVSGTEDLGTSIETYMKVNLFAPVANNYEPKLGEKEIDILIATDTLSEGVNLQDCGVVVNYDIPWNPMRMVQRAGRSDRIGSTTRTTVRNILPDEEFDNLFLKLLEKVLGKIETITAILGTENQIVTDDETAIPKTFGEAIQQMGDPGDIGAYEKMGRNRLFRNIRTSEKRSEIMLKIRERVRNLGPIPGDVREYRDVMYSTVRARKTDRTGIFMMFRVFDTARDEKLNDVIIFRENNDVFHEIAIDDFLASIPMDEFDEGIPQTNDMSQTLGEIEEHFAANQFKGIREGFRPSKMGTFTRMDLFQEYVRDRLHAIKSARQLDGYDANVSELYEKINGTTLRKAEVNLLKGCFGVRKKRKQIRTMPVDEFIETIANFCSQYMENNPNYPKPRNVEDIEYKKICWGAFV